MLGYLVVLIFFSFFSFANIPTFTYSNTYNIQENLLNTSDSKTYDALGNETSFIYDAQGNRLCVTNALGQTTSYEYNALNQRIKTTYADNTSTIENKNISGLPTSKTDEAGTITSYGYDTSKNIPLLNSVTLANGAITSYTYDSQNRKSKQTDALNHSTSWNYTDLGELKDETLPQGEVKSFTYDSYGKSTQINDYANKAQKFIYDSNDKLVRIEYADGNAITYDYTPSGRLKSKTDAQGTITNTYDSLGRLKTQSNSNNEFIAYSYDDVGNIILIETPTQSISKTYTKRNALASVSDSTGTTSYIYDELGRQTQILYPNGVSTEYEYNNRNRILKISHSNSSNFILQSFTYTLDALGNRVKILEENERTVAYAYNSVNQLIKEVVSHDPNNKNTSTTYTYDDVGNLQTKTIDGINTEYSYNENDQLILKDSITYSYDDNGNLLSKDDTSYEYDALNRLIKLDTPNNTIEYSYDANNNRIAKTTNGDSTSYLIDTNTPYAQVITESKTDGTTVEYTYGNDLINNGSSFFLTDALGSTRGLVDGGENLTDSYNYTPYGTLSDHNGTSDNNFLFTGEQRDKQSNNYYLRARYYSPESGRFISRDSYDGRDNEPATLNHYGYVHGNPVNYTDPSGHMLLVQGVGAMGLMGGFSTISMTQLGLISYGLANLTLNKKYYINVRYGRGHGYVHASSIQGDTGYQYDFVYREDNALLAELYIPVSGYIRKTTTGNHFNSSFVRLSNLQFKAWEVAVFKIFPKASDSGRYSNRHMIYWKPMFNCYGYAYYAYLVRPRRHSTSKV